MSAQTWNAEGYAKNARFVTDLGAPVFELLAPQPGESILDVGCGDGVLTKKIAEVGCQVVGLDSSREFCVAARRLGINVVELSASNMTFAGEFDAVFSNAALHWMKDAGRVVDNVPELCAREGDSWLKWVGTGVLKTSESR
jgi:trans-aconitate methyltransferase